MKTLAKLLCCIFASSSVLATENTDLINFENDDTLHGTFIGFTSSGRIIWKNNSAEKNIAFETTELRRIILNKGKRTKPFTHVGYVTLKNLDTVPGKILSLTDDQLTLETDFAGTITIPKDKIFNININPVGNKIIYRGPLVKDEPWILKHPTPIKHAHINLPDTKGKKSWEVKNFSLLHQTKGVPGSILRQMKMPDKYRMTFAVHSVQSSCPTLTIMADLKIPEVPKPKENKVIEKNKIRRVGLPTTNLGTSIIITMFPNRSLLTLYSYQENGELLVSQVANSTSMVSAQTASNSTTFYDLRVDKAAGTILLFANKIKIGTWRIESLADKFSGSYFGFNMQYNREGAKTAVSDIICSRWNGVRDSALSLENESRDIVMLNNGTDRYSGKITSINESSVELKSAYANLSIPHDQVSSITLARKRSETPDLREKSDSNICFYGTGKITGLLSKSDDNSVFLESKIFGKIKVKSEFISLFEFMDIDHSIEALE